MTTKKTEKADLQNKKLLFAEIGCIIALTVVYFGFEFTSAETRTMVLEETSEVFFTEENVPITQETPPPPPKVQVPVLSDIIDIVEDDIMVDDNLFLKEDDFDKAVEIIDYYEFEEEEVEEEEIPFAIVEEKPKFQNGDANMFSKWVNQRLVYPEIAKETGVQGRIILQFTIEKDGSMSKVKVLRGVDPSLDKEAVRVVSMSPKWKPGKQRDRAVAVTYTFPVVFQLR